jgi:carnitine monooxygenase subunit
MIQQQSTLIKSLDARVYLDPEIFLREQQAIFASTWQYACHVEKLRSPGDYCVREIAGESLILIREDARRINGFYNVCPHRAAQMVSGEGCSKRLSCPYHAWTFNTRGDLIAAPNAQNVPGFKLADYRLRSCRVEVLHGLVFVNLDNLAAPMIEQVPEFAQDLVAYAPDMPELTFVHRSEAMLQANWKVAIENFAECYHCELLHRDLARNVLDMDSYRIEVFERSQKHLSESRSGDDRAYRFEDLSATDFVSWWLWPNFCFQSYPGGRAHVWYWTPLDIEHTRLRVDWYFPSKDMADWESELIRHHTATTFREDQEIIASAQRGLNSRGYRPGPLMIDAAHSQYSEHGVAAVQQWWREAMGEEGE